VRALAQGEERGVCDRDSKIIEKPEYDESCNIRRWGCKEIVNEEVWKEGG